MAYAFHIVWLFPTESKVQVTGDFDNWSRLLPEYTGTKFVQKIVLPERRKVAFKFIVNGDWTVSKDFAIVKDEFGNENNVVEIGELKEETSGGPVDTHQDSSVEAVPELPDASPLAESTPIPSTNTFSETDSTAELSKSAERILNPVTKPGETGNDKGSENTPARIEKAALTATSGSIEAEKPEYSPPALHETSSLPDPEIEGGSIQSFHVQSIASEATDGEAEPSPELVDDPILDSEIISIGSKPLAPVTTSQSSFAAVSIPDSVDEYEKIEPNVESPKDLSDFKLIGDKKDEDTEDDFDTPTNSLLNLAVIGEGESATTSSPGKFSHGITKPSLIPVEDKKEEGRRENLISRFRGLFKY